MNPADGPLEHEVRQEIAEAFRPQQPVRRWMYARRHWARTHPQFRMVYLMLVAIVGIVFVVGGLVLVPLPGPGWLIVFLGLAILGTEFLWARKLTGWTRRRLERFWQWWRSRQTRNRG